MQTSRGRCLVPLVAGVLGLVILAGWRAGDFGPSLWNVTEVSPLPPNSDAVGASIVQSTVISEPKRVRIPLRRVKLPTERALNIPNSRRPAAVESRPLQPGGPLVQDEDRDVSLTNRGTTVYLGPLYVGTPYQEFTVIYDTGSADVWVLSEKYLNTRARPSKSHFYNSSASSTWRPSNDSTWNVRYGKGSVQGFVSLEAISIDPEDNITASNQAFGEATAVADIGSDDNPIDGILGLAFREAASDKRDGGVLMDTLKAQGQIDERVFSFYLTDEPNEPGSEMVIGAPEDNHAPKGLAYIDLYQEYSGMWFIPLDGIIVGASRLGNCNPCVALMDTGTSLIQIPAAWWKDFIASVTYSGSGCSTRQDGLVSCSSSHGLARVSFVFNGKPFYLRPEQYMFADNLLGFAKGSEDDSGLIIIGDTFLRHYYTVFDMERKRIGIAYPPDMPTVTPVVVGVTVGLVAVTFAAAFGIVFFRKRRHTIGGFRTREGRILVSQDDSSEATAPPVDSAH